MNHNLKNYIQKKLYEAIENIKLDEVLEIVNTGYKIEEGDILLANSYQEKWECYKPNCDKMKKIVSHLTASFEKNKIELMLQNTKYSKSIKL